MKGKGNFSLHSEIKTYDHAYALRQIPAKSYLAPLLAKKEQHLHITNANYKQIFFKTARFV